MIRITINWRSQPSVIKVNNIYFSKSTTQVVTPKITNLLLCYCIELGIQLTCCVNVVSEGVNIFKIITASMSSYVI